MSLFPLTVRSCHAARLIAISACCLYLTTAGGGLQSIDAVMTYEVTKSLVSSGSTAFDAPGLNQHPGVDGRYYSRFGVGQSVFNIPFYVAGRAVRQGLGLRMGRSETLDKAAVALGSTVAAAGMVWVVYLFAWRLSGSAVAARRTALALALGTLVWPYSKFGFNVTLTAWCLTAGIYSAWIGVRLDRDRTLAASAVWLAGAFLTRHEMAVAAMLVGVWIAFESRVAWRRVAGRLLWFGVPLAAALAFWLWYNYVRFGSPLDPGNLDDPVVGFDAPILVGIQGFLFSPGRSLFIYVPLALAGVLSYPAFARRDGSLAVLFVALMTSLVLVYSSMWAWDGLRSYGPRYLVPLLPMLIVPLVWWLEPGKQWWRRGLLLLVGFSVVIQLPGVLVDFSKVSVEHGRAVGGYSRDAKVYNWRETGLVLDTIAAVEAVPKNLRYLVRGERPPGIHQAVGEDDRDFGQRLAFSLDFWWLYLYYLGAVSAPVAVVLGLAPLALGWLSLRRNIALDGPLPQRLSQA
jgi:hypothetical protein